MTVTTVSRYFTESRHFLRSGKRHVWTLTGYALCWEQYIVVFCFTRLPELKQSRNIVRTNSRSEMNWNRVALCSIAHTSDNNHKPNFWTQPISKRMHANNSIQFFFTYNISFSPTIPDSPNIQTHTQKTNKITI